MTASTTHLWLDTRSQDPTKDGAQMNSELYVGTPDDCPWLPAGNPMVKGTVTYISYTDIKGDPRSLGVYLPAGYDRTKEYPVVYVSHGGGGDEADWFCWPEMFTHFAKAVLWK